MRAARSSLAAAGSRRPGGQPDSPAAPSAATRATPGKGDKIGAKQRRNQCAANQSSVSPGMGSPGQRKKAGEAGGGEGEGSQCRACSPRPPPPHQHRRVSLTSTVLDTNLGKYGVGRSCHLEKDLLTTWPRSYRVSIVLVGPTKIVLTRRAPAPHWWTRWPRRTALRARRCRPRGTKFGS